MRIRAELEASGKNTAGFEVPESAADGLGDGTWVHFGRPCGRTFVVRASTQRTKVAGTVVGETYEADVELDTAPRAVPSAADGPAKRLSESLSYVARSWSALQITGPEKVENPRGQRGEVGRHAGRGPSALT